MNAIPRNVIDQAMNYDTYRSLIDDLLTENKTTGENHSDAMINYTQLNVARMKRLDKTTKLLPDLAARLVDIDRPMVWLTITEGWCGDAAQIVPVIEKMASSSNLVETKYILRDEHLEIMDAFLTNGARSIPKVIILDAHSLEVLGTWGPRPGEIQNIVMQLKEEVKELSKEDAKARMNESKRAVQLWYTKDKTKSIQSEFLDTLQEALFRLQV